MYMKTRIIKFALVIAAIFTNGTAIAYEADFSEDVCKKPKFTDFNLTEYKEPEKLEVAPESEFEFKISVWADPTTIKLSGKREKIDFTVESTSTFHRVKAKLPARLNGKFARIDASVKAILGCDEQAGWLVKIADKKPEANTSAAQPENSAPQANMPAAQTETSAPEADTVAPQANTPEPKAGTSAIEAGTKTPQ